MSRFLGLASGPAADHLPVMADAEPLQQAREVTATVDGNKLTLLPDGPGRLDALLDLIRSARESLRFLYYMINPDASATQVRDALVEACGRGVKVTVLIDGFGSDAGEDFFRPLVGAGCGFCRFSPRFGRRYLLRNHQKLALADSRRVMIGGFNISDDYFGTVESGAWRDLGLLVEGPSVECLVSYFDKLFAWAQKPRGRIRELRRMLHQGSVTEGKLHWLFGGPTRRLSPWARSVRQDMRSAKRLDMIAAYFSPGPGMLTRIAGIARRGRARVITAAKSDNGTTIAAARNTYWWMLKRGVEIYEYQPTKLHTKLFVVDDAVHVGSANFDMRSLFLNLEMMLRVQDAGFAASMRAFVDGEVAASERITRDKHRARRSLLNRLRWAAAYFVVGVADYRISRVLNFGPDGR
jgi:cardiolipin synthase